MMKTAEIELYQDKACFKSMNKEVLMSDRCLDDIVYL